MRRSNDDPIAERQKLAGWLERFKRNKTAVRLAETIACCTSRNPCGSGACPVCASLAQQDLVAALEEQAADTSLSFVSIVPAASTVAPGDLHAFSHTNHGRRLKYASGGLYFEWAVFVTDFSFNKHAKNRYPPHWSIHVYGFVAGVHPVDFKWQLTKTFNSTNITPRPVKITSLDNYPDALSYLLSNDFDRRIGRDDGLRFNPRTRQHRICHIVQHDRIRSADRFTLFIHLDEIGINSRLISLNSQLRLTRTGQKLVLLRRDMS